MFAAYSTWSKTGRALDALAVLDAFVHGGADRVALDHATQEIAAIANSHRGSSSIDGSAHAAVSATYAVARPLPASARSFAGYAAGDGSVDAYGGYAVNDPSAFEAEHTWQIQTLRDLA